VLICNYAFVLCTVYTDYHEVRYRNNWQDCLRNAFCLFRGGRLQLGKLAEKPGNPECLAYGSRFSHSAARRRLRLMHLANPAKLIASSLRELPGKTLPWAIESNNESEPREFQKGFFRNRKAKGFRA